MVGRVREVLRLQAEPVGLPVHLAAGSDQRRVEEVARVELDPRLGRVDLHDPTGRRLMHPGSQAERHRPAACRARSCGRSPSRTRAAGRRCGCARDGGRAREVHRAAGHLSRSRRSGSARRRPA